MGRLTRVDSGFQLTVTADEYRIVLGSINEALEAIQDENEFSTRLGATRTEARNLLQQLQAERL